MTVIIRKPVILRRERPIIRRRRRPVIRQLERPTVLINCNNCRGDDGDGC